MNKKCSFGIKLRYQSQLLNKSKSKVYTRKDDIPNVFERIYQDGILDHDQNQIYNHLYQSERKIPKNLLLNPRLLPKKVKQKVNEKSQGKPIKKRQIKKRSRPITTSTHENVDISTVNNSNIDFQINDELQNIQTIYQQLQKATFKLWQQNNFL